MTEALLTASRRHCVPTNSLTAKCPHWAFRKMKICSKVVWSKWWRIVQRRVLYWFAGSFVFGCALGVWIALTSSEGESPTHLGLLCGAMMGVLGALYQLKRAAYLLAEMEERN